MRQDNKFGTLAAGALVVLLVMMAVVVMIAIRLNNPGPPTPVSVRSLEERDSMDAAAEAAARDLVGAGRKAPVLKPDAPTQFRESVQKARERLNSGP